MYAEEKLSEERENFWTHYIIESRGREMITD